MRVSSVVLLTLLLGEAAHAQTTRHVPAQYPTIQSAISACVNGDDVLVAPGVYPGAIDFLGKTIVVHSSGGAAVTTIAGSSSSAVVSFVTGEGPQSGLDGFTVSGGIGGVSIVNASPAISHCSIVNNFATPIGGSGIRCSSTGVGTASPSITACTISHNLSTDGGAGINFDCQSSNGSFPVLDGCVVSSNFPSLATGNTVDGGGLRVAFLCTLVATDCTFADNSADTGGGCVLLQATSATFTRCRFTGNHVSLWGWGAGLAISNTSAVLDGCLVANNQSQNLIGGIDIQAWSGQTVLVRGCTVTGNQAAYICGGVSVPSGPGVSIIDSIIWGNSGTDLEAANAVVAYCDVGYGYFSGGTGVISADPRFVDPVHGDYHLARSSPCRDAGMPGGAGPTVTDLDGTPRVVNGTVDIGADEVPVLFYPGTNEDLELYGLVNGLGDPLASTRGCAPGSQLKFLFRSPGGSFTGANPLLAGVLFASGSPPLSIPGFPQVWLNGNVFVILGALNPPPFTLPGLPAAGITLEYLVPPGFAGTTVRLQALVTTPFAANGAWAITNATESVF